MHLFRAKIAALGLLCSLASAASLGLPSDKEQAIHISADQATRDEKAGLTTYTGSVEFVQGTLRITADKITIYQELEGAGKIVAIGKPARLQQKPEIDKELMHAHAQTIEYHEKEDRIHLQTNAQIEQGGSKVTGKTIDYFISKELVKADSDASQESSRVNVIIPPSMIDRKEDKEEHGAADSK
jgi:lipopolysaccharide export system protein LptA